jgi:hypothetical protein
VGTVQLVLDQPQNREALLVLDTASGAGTGGVIPNFALLPRAGCAARRCITAPPGQFIDAQSKVRTVRATSPAFIARNASLMSPSVPRRVIISSSSNRPWR